MKLASAMEFVADRSKGVLATVRSNGLPQMSNIVYSAGAEAIRISITDGRAKTANLRRDPRAVLHVTSEDFWKYVVVECNVEMSAVAKQVGDPALEELRELYQSISGEHPDWDDYDRAMLDESRLVLRLTPVHAYGMV